MDAENFVKLGAGAVQFCLFEFVDDDCQGELAEIVALEFELLDALPEFPGLRFLGIVEQSILLRRIVKVHLAEERSLRIVEVPPFGLDRAPGLAGILLLPFSHHEIVGFNFKEALKDKRKALRGGFLQRKHFDVVVVESQVSPVALEKRVAELCIEESVVPEPGESDLQRRKVQRSVQDPKRLLLVEQAHGQEVADLQDEATEFLVENRL